MSKQLRLSGGIAGLVALLITFSGGPVAACIVATPPSCEATESEAACRERAEQWYAEQEAARLIYEQKTPAERALDEQSQLWDHNALGRELIMPEPDTDASKLDHCEIG